MLANFDNDLKKKKKKFTHKKLLERHKRKSVRVFTSLIINTDKE